MGSQYCSAKDMECVIDKYGFVDFRRSIHRILKILPETDCPIGEWIDRANVAFQDGEINLELKIKTSQKNLSFDGLFGADNKQITESDYRIGTIHSVKGEPEIGYAMHCALDFGETGAFSPDIILKRTRTLMWTSHILDFKDIFLQTKVCAKKARKLLLRY